jgi:OOP family OmpA-OmpF porin
VRKYLLTAAAAAAIATPAAARDHSGYIGVDAGLLLPVKSTVHINGADSYYANYFDYYFGGYTAAFRTKYNTGVDVDLVGGYDFGMFRFEGELGYKHAGHDRYSARAVTNSDIFTSIDADGSTSSTSAMFNGLVDFGSDNSLSFSVGAGLGMARTKYRFRINDPALNDIGLGTTTLSTTASNSRLAWQLLAEARYAVSPEFDVGVKYRYFNAGKIRRAFDDGMGGVIRADTRFRSHSILLSLVYNLAAPLPPPPPNCRPG